MVDPEPSENDLTPPGRLGRGNGDLSRFLAMLLLAVLVLVAVFLLARHVRPGVHALEDWIGGHRILGPVAFVASIVVLTSVFVPDTALAVAAGVAFGLVWGTVVITVGALLTATVNFFLSRWFLRHQIDRMLGKRPKLSAIKKAVSRGGVRLLILLRLTPINPVVVSYVMGTTRLKYVAFLAGSLAMIPALFVEVYFGYVAKRVAKVAGGPGHHSPIQMIATVVGLAACVAALIYVTRLARRALVEAEAEEASDAADGQDAAEQ